MAYSLITLSVSLEKLGEENGCGLFLDTVTNSLVGTEENIERSQDV
jgi:hypothetical protein